MNNINRDKIIKMLVTVAAICVFVGGVTKLAGAGSMTLTEFVKKNGGTPPTETSSETQESTQSQTQESTAADNQETNVSPLVGASLNGDSQESLRITYQDSFYYEPLSDHLKRYITGVSFPAQSENGEDLAIEYEDLRYLHILYYDFEGNAVEGEVICNEFIAQDLAEIFYELYRSEYRLEQVHLIDEYEGDDVASMEANNTSCFNYRVVDGTSSLSKHALGLAIDINPLYNPYVVYEKDGSEYVSPAAAIDYVDRDANFPYKIDEQDLAYKLFKEHGFTWGGDWNSCKDYQHFQKTP